MTSEMAGYVTDILYKEGENLAAGYPVIVVRNQKQVINVGLDQTDAAKIKLGTKAEFSFCLHKSTKLNKIIHLPDAWQDNVLLWSKFAISSMNYEKI